MKNKLTIAILAIFAVSTSNVALAEEKSRHGFYAGADVGLAKIKGYCSRFKEFAPDVSCDDSEIGFGGFGGFAFNDYLGLEAGVKYASGFDYEIINGDAGTENEYDEKGKSTVYNLSFGGTGRFPITEWLAITGKAGLNAQQFLWKGDGDTDSDGAYSFRNKDFAIRPYYGAGIEISPFAESGFSGLIEWSRYKGKGFGRGARPSRDVDMDYFSAKIVYNF